MSPPLYSVEAIPTAASALNAARESATTTSPAATPNALAATRMGDSYPRLSVAVGAGVGGGTPGNLAGALHAGLDAWFWPDFGFGIEGLAAGSTQLLPFVGDSTLDTQYAVRVRLNARHLFGRERNMFAASFAAGLGYYRTFYDREYAYGPSDDCSSPLCSGTLHEYGQESKGLGFSYGLDLGWTHFWNLFQLGVNLRVDGTGTAVVLSIGPTLGVHW
jgi:hypothetical protein